MKSRLSQRTAVRAGAVALALAVIFATYIVLRPTPDPLRADAVTDPPFTPLTYSIQTFLWWDDHSANLHLDWVRLMVFSHIKQTFAWEDIEPARDDWQYHRADEVVDAAERRGIRIIARLSDAPEWVHPGIPGRKDEDFIDGPPDAEYMGEWAAYCGGLAERYRGRIAAYQVWNEPNLSREWGNRPPDAAAYTDLLRVCSESIRAADPDAIIISAGLAPTGTCCDSAQPDTDYLQALYDSGFQQYVDVVGMHAPGYAAPQVSPDEAEAAGSQRFFTFRRVEDLRRIMVENGDAARQAAILEMGWHTDTEGYNPDYAWYGVTEAQQARYLEEAYAYAAEHWRPWVGLMSAIYIANPAWTRDNEEYWWSITTPDGYVRPAFITLANMAKYCGDRVIPARDPGSPEALGQVIVEPCD